MKTFNIDCELNYDVAQSTVFVFNLQAASARGQKVCAESMITDPSADVDHFTDLTSGNRFTRVNAQPGPFSIRYLANVDAAEPAVDVWAPEVPLAELPGECLPFVLSSRYCEAEQLFPIAVREFGHLPRGYSRVQAICKWIREHIAYQVGSSSPLTTARDVLANRAGVCRDFAHVAISFCRALNIPARFVTGYARYGVPPPDFHAVFEAYLGGRWYLFDPTELAKLDEIVRIGTGRDASEVAFATFFGAARMRRLSPLIEPMVSDARPRDCFLTCLQTPDSGILLAA